MADKKYHLNTVFDTKNISQRKCFCVQLCALTTIPQQIHGGMENLEFGQLDHGKWLNNDHRTMNEKQKYNMPCLQKFIENKTNPLYH